MLKHSIMAILLPSQIRNDLKQSNPIRVGDKLPSGLLEEIKGENQNLKPASEFCQKRLSFLAQGTETLLTSFELNDKSLPSSTGFQVCIVTNASVSGMKCILSDENETSAIKCQLLADPLWSLLLGCMKAPQLILIEPNGIISRIYFGQYINGDNIRKWASYGEII